MSIALLWITLTGTVIPVSQDNAHIIAHYVPSIGGTISTLVFRSIVGDMLRIMPYILMSRRGGAYGKHCVASSYWPLNTFGGRGSTATVDAISIVSVLAGYVTAFKAGLFYLSSTVNETFLNTNVICALALSVLYAMMSVACLCITIFIWKCKSTGLKWDPTSIADIISLFRDSNARKDFQDRQPNLPAAKRTNQCIKERYYLGCTLSRYGTAEQTTSYTISHASNALHRRSLSSSERFGVQPIEATSNLSDLSVDPSLTVHGDSEARIVPFPGIRRGFPVVQAVYSLVWFGSIAFGIYALSHGFVHSGFDVANMLHCHQGYNDSSCILQHNETSTSTDGFLNLHFGTSADQDIWIYILLTRALPTVFAGMFAVGYLTSTLNFHAFAQPFSDMFIKPTAAENCALLDYFSGSVLTIITQAAEFDHYKLVYIAILQLLSNAFPILVGALFPTITNNGLLVTFTVSSFAFWSIMIFATIYAVTMIFLWKTDKRKIINPQWNIADLMGMCWNSRFLDEQEFDVSGAGMSKRLFRARVVAAGYRFSYGYYKGQDGYHHPGFDAVEIRGRAVNDVRHWKDIRA